MIMKMMNSMPLHSFRVNFTGYHLLRLTSKVITSKGIIPIHTYEGRGISHGNYFFSGGYVNGSQKYICLVEVLQA